MARSPYMHDSTPNLASINALIAHANKAAIAQGGSSTVQATQIWWNRRVRHSFDYV